MQYWNRPDGVPFGFWSIPQFVTPAAHAPAPPFMQVRNCVVLTANLLPESYAPSSALIDAHSAIRPFWPSSQFEMLLIAATSFEFGELLPPADVSQCGAHTA